MLTNHPTKRQNWIQYVLSDLKEGYKPLIRAKGEKSSFPTPKVKNRDFIPFFSESAQIDTAPDTLIELGIKRIG